MKERAADIRDISERVIANLNGENKSKVVTDEPVIILADDLAPSETVQLEKDKVLSFVTVHGSVNSHTAILARHHGDSGTGKYRDGADRRSGWQTGCCRRQPRHDLCGAGC